MITTEHKTAQISFFVEHVDLQGEGVPGTYLAEGKCHNSDPFPIFANYLGGFVYESFWVSFFLALGSTTTFLGSRGRPWTPTALLPDCSAA